MESPILKGPRIRLRPVQESDKQDRLACGRDPEFRRMVGGDPNVCPPLTLDEVEQWAARMRSEALHWIIEREQHAIGTARLHQLDPDNRRARYAIGIFDPALWGQGLGTEATRLVLAHAFDVLGLHRVDLRVLAFNTRAIACYEKCGFVQEGIEREGALIGDEWQSDVFMSILEQEYRRSQVASPSKR